MLKTFKCVYDCMSYIINKYNPTMKTRKKYVEILQSKKWLTINGNHFLIDEFNILD